MTFSCYRALFALLTALTRKGVLNERVNNLRARTQRNAALIQLGGAMISNIEYGIGEMKKNVETLETRYPSTEGGVRVCRCEPAGEPAGVVGSAVVFASQAREASSRPTYSSSRLPNQGIFESQRMKRAIESVHRKTVRKANGEC